MFKFAKSLQNTATASSTPRMYFFGSTKLSFIYLFYCRSNPFHVTNGLPGWPGSHNWDNWTPTRNEGNWHHLGIFIWKVRYYNNFFKKSYPSIQLFLCIQQPFTEHLKCARASLGGPWGRKSVKNGSESTPATKGAHTLVGGEEGTDTNNSNQDWSLCAHLFIQ